MSIFLISALCLKFYPRNIIYMPAVDMPVVKISSHALILSKSPIFAKGSVASEIIFLMGESDDYRMS